MARVAGYYPLFILVQILFGAMFAFADNFYNGPVATFAHAVMSATLTQVGAGGGGVGCGGEGVEPGCMEPGCVWSGGIELTRRASGAGAG